MIRTSHTHPLKIATLPVGPNGGAIGVTFAPGKHQASAMTGQWARDLDTDLAAIRDWGATTLVSLLEAHEFSDLKIPDLPQRARAQGLDWFGLPITDGMTPDFRLLDQWPTIGHRLASQILSGRRVVVHCKGGLGRAGTVAAMLLLDTGAAMDGDDAMARVRAVRPGAVENSHQEAFIRQWRNARGGDR